jgi:hypothetical protein
LYSNFLLLNYYKWNDVNHKINYNNRLFESDTKPLSPFTYEAFNSLDFLDPYEPDNPDFLSLVGDTISLFNFYTLSLYVI